MTETERKAPERTTSFDERVEILASELELAVKWQRPCILLVVYRSEYVRAEAQAALENHLLDLGQHSAHLRIREGEHSEPRAFLKEFEDAANAVCFVDGFRRGKGAEAELYSTLNLHREFFAERQIRTVFWLTQNEIMGLARAAPDFWAYRDRMIEFVESPKAEQVLQQALESAWQGTGEYAQAPDDTDASISLRESLLSDLPRGEEASSSRANLLLMLGVLNWRKGDYEQADEQLQEALQIAAKLQDPWFEAECFNALALIRASTERTEEAIDAYRQAIRLAPDQVFAWNNLGNLCAKIGRHDEAMTAFRKAIDGNPRDPVAWSGLGTLHFKIGCVDDAIGDFRKAIRYMPGFAQPWIGLGDVYASIGRPDEAVKAYQQAIELNRQYVTPWIRLGALLAKQGDFDEAVKAYQGALALDPNNSTLWNELGTIHGKSETLDEAEEAFSRAIQLDRRNGCAYSNLALAYMQQGRHKETISLLLRSLDLLENDTDKAVSWNHLGQIYRFLNDYDNATAAYQMADRLDPDVAASKLEYLRNRWIQSFAADTRDVSEPVVKNVPTDAPGISARAAAIRNALGQLPVAATDGSAGPNRNYQSMDDAPSWIVKRSGEVNSAPAQTRRPEGASESQGTEDPMTEPIHDPIPAFEGEPEPVDGRGADGSPPSAGVTADATEWTERGNAFFRGGAPSDAVDAYREAIRLDPALGAPYSNLALTFLTQGQFAEAVLLYRKSLEILHSDKDKALSWNGLGNAYRCLNDYPSAVSAYQRAAELDPETNGIRDRAEDFQSPAVPRNAQGWNDLGMFFLKTGSADEAIHAFKKAIELDPAAGLPYGNLVRVLAARGRYTEALPVCQKSIELLSDNKEKAAAWNQLGNLHRKLNNYDGAIEAFRKAAELRDRGADLLTRTRFSLLSNCHVNQ